MSKRPPDDEEEAPVIHGATHTEDGRDLAALWAQFRRNGDTESRNALTEFYFDMVRANADNIAEILLEAVEQNDLSQAGAVAFFEALNEYDPEEHGTFEDFGSMTIRRAIMDELRGLVGVDWTPPKRDQ